MSKDYLVRIYNGSSKQLEEDMETLLNKLSSSYKKVTIEKIELISNSITTTNSVVTILLVVSVELV